MFVLVHLAAKSFGYDVEKLNQIWHQRLHWNVFDENYWKNLVLVHFTAAKSFGKVDLTINVDHLESVEVSGQRQRFIFQT